MFLQTTDAYSKPIWSAANLLFIPNSLLSRRRRHSIRRSTSSVIKSQWTSCAARPRRPTTRVKVKSTQTKTRRRCGPKTIRWIGSKSFPWSSWPSWTRWVCRTGFSRTMPTHTWVSHTRSCPQLRTSTTHRKQKRATQIGNGLLRFPRSSARTTTLVLCSFRPWYKLSLNHFSRNIMHRRHQLGLRF